MTALCVTIHVKPEAIDDFIVIMEEQVRQTRQEPGNLRYECLQADNSIFILYEAYASEEAFQIHRTAPHTLRWKTATEPLMAQPRSAIRGTALFPDADSGSTGNGQAPRPSKD